MGKYTQISIEPFQSSENLFPPLLYFCPMIVFVTALLDEARPLIDCFKLKQYKSIRSIRFFKGENDVFLIISGTGSLSCNSAVTSFLSNQENQPLLMLNIGICGANDSLTKGDVYLIASAKDVNTEIVYYPDLLIKSPFPLEHLETHPKPVDSQQSTEAALFDMEASGFFHAAQLYLPPHAAQSIKIISDFGSEEWLRSEQVQSLISTQLDSIADFVESYRAAIKADNLFTEETEQWFSSVCDILRLTTTQERDLRQVLRYFLISSDKPLPEIPEKPEQISKSQQKTIYNEFRKSLLL